MHWVSKIRNEQIVPEPGMIVHLMGYAPNYMLVYDRLSDKWGVVESQGNGWLRWDEHIGNLILFLNSCEAKLVFQR